jgi:hypothetical protein
MTGASDELTRLMAEKRPRAKVEPEGHMRERIAVALHEYYQEWADRLLAHFDVLDLEISDTRSTST